MYATASNCPANPLKTANALPHLQTHEDCATYGNACSSIAQLDDCKEISRKAHRNTVGFTSSVKPQLVVSVNLLSLSHIKTPSWYKRRGLTH